MTISYKATYKRTNMCFISVANYNYERFDGPLTTPKEEEEEAEAVINVEIVNDVFCTKLCIVCALARFIFSCSGTVNLLYI